MATRPVSTPRVVIPLLAIPLLAIPLVAIWLLPFLSRLPAASAVPALPAPAVTTVPAALSITLGTVTPTVAIPQAPIIIRGSISNVGPVQIASPVARALLGQRPLTTRQGVADWATSTSEQPLTEVARFPVGKPLAPGAVVEFSLTIPASRISHSEAFAVLPLRVAGEGATPTSTQGVTELGGLNTFLPVLAAVKAFEPISIAWLVPLMLDPDPALYGMDSPARTTAWAKAIGPGSRLDRLIQGTQDENVTWAIDPAILGPRQTPDAGTSSPTSPGPTPSQAPSQTPSPGGAPGTTTDPVTAATTALAARLRAAAPRHTLWALPYADPDLSALLALPTGGRVLRRLVSNPSPLTVSVGPARADIAWPVTGFLTPRSEAQLRRAFAAPRLAAVVTSASTLTSRNGSASDASRKSDTGLPLLAYDEPLSRTVAQTFSRKRGALTIQRFLADSMALLGERPGTPNRSVLVAEPRTFAGDPAVLRAFFTAIGKAPWLITTTTDQLVATSQKLASAAPGEGILSSQVPSAAPSPSASAGGKPAASDPLDPGVSPLTPGVLAAIPRRLAAITGIASILDDGRLFTQRWTDAQDQLLSTRWRGHPGGLAAIEDATKAAIGAVSRSVNVSPSSVNFFADRGVLQVTVVNGLSVPIHDVHLSLTPAQPRLRIEHQPGPLKIGAKSRTNVPLQVTSIAAGLVPIEAALTTRNGTPLGQNANVDVRVQPTSTWIYWVLGGLGGFVLVLGTYRSLRGGSRRVSRRVAQDLAQELAPDAGPR